jgi:GNAT superfamily N-acetyltransferase
MTFDPLNGTATVVSAQAADVGTLSQVIADAFHDLAPSRWLIEDQASRRAIFPSYFRLFVEDAMARGVVHTTPDRSAVALWLPVGAGGSDAPAGYGERLAEVTQPWTYRFRAFDAILDKHHPTGTAHHHLAMLAVRPDRQRRRLGTTLLHAYHAELDRSGGVPTYLEAANLATRELYLGHGYRDIGPPIKLPGGPAMYPMWRERTMGRQPI